MSAGQDGVVGMHGGLPPPAAFPLSSASCTVPNLAASDGAEEPATFSFEGDDLARFQQYNLERTGAPKLREWLTEHVRRLHKPAHPEFDLSVTTGAMQNFTAAMRALVNPGDSILVEEFLFSQVLEAALVPMNIRPKPVKMDSEGLVPEDLDRVMEEAKAAGDSVPRVIYCVPHGQNPTGSLMGAARKRAIYRLCRKHDLILLEDDPYIYLQFSEDDASDVPGLNVEPGFLHLDVDGRVLSVGTFSKCLAPGFRLGWLAGAPDLVKLVRTTAFDDSMGPSGISQMVAYGLLSTWGHDGFERHLKHVQSLYREKAKVLHEALTEHCAGLAAWEFPKAGMFFWLDVDASVCDDVDDLFPDLVAEKVVIVPGKIFHVCGNDKAFKCRKARLAFPNSTPAQLIEGARRLGAVLHHAADRRKAAASPNDFDKVDNYVRVSPMA